jgi:hypothetical protein
MRLNRKQVQALLGISEDTLLADPVRFGGVWLGPRKLVFFEKLISEAIRELYANQKDKKKRDNVDRSCDAPEWEASREGVSDEAGGAEMGVHPAVRAFARENRADLWQMAEPKN